MSKTLVWVLIGALAAAVAAVAVVQLRPQGSAAVSAAATGSAKGDAAPSAAPAEPSAQETAQPVAGPMVPSEAAALSTTPTVDDLIQSAAAYEGRSVSLKGTIITQCTAGCEFALDDGTGVLSIQLEGKGKDRLLPLGKVGKMIQVVGVFHASPRPQVVIEDPNGWQFVKS